MPTTSKLTPCGSACSIDEQVQAVEIKASLSGYDGYDDVSSTITSDPGRSTCKDDVNTESSEMRLKRQQKAMPAREDEDEYTLCAFGDISLSNINFVPGPSAALSLEKKANKSAPATPRAFEQYLPKVIRKILPPSPSKASVSSVEMDFETINNYLKRSRDGVEPKPPPVTSRKPIVDRDEILYSPQPRRLIDLQNFGIRRSHDINEPMQCKLVSTASTGNLRANEKHARWDSSDMGQGIGYHLGLGPACLKLT